MASNFELLRSTVSNLSIDDSNRTRLLSDLKLAVGSLSSAEQKLAIRSLELENIFDCLNSSETEQIVLTCEVLSQLLSALEPSFVFRKYEEALRRALGHPAPRVKQLVLKELQRAADNSSFVEQLSLQEAILLSVVACVCHEDMSVASSAVAVLISLGASPVGLNILYAAPMVQALRAAMAQQDVIRFRVYEVVAEVAGHSDAGLQAAHDSGLLPALTAELNNSDILLQMNALELVTKLALFENGLQYLQQHGIVTALANKVTAINEDPLASLTLPGLIKFFGNVAQLWPKEMSAEYPNVVTALFETFDSPDLVLLGVAMETVGYIGTSVEGKYMLDSLGDMMNKTMKKLGNKITNLPTEWKVRALNTVANLLELKVADQDTLSLAITKSWFEQLASNPMDLVVSVCRQPFTELRLAGLQVLRVLAEQQWGQENINSTPGLIEFLLDRGMESNKICKDSKFEVVKTLAESPTGATTFGNVMLLRLQEFIREGPFYVQAQSEVAIEGAL
ncbi:hypothetical protein Cfor_09925 [Coptotermes formosanus]|uniref:26S proteasome non-ATPase regulatory subunit 5 n=1 Tax=Coptotermes formosanus TaxID=36987 RepID=A0A6L2PIM4_COPFO|nr:hypothetical protein Cfor_09925 [Coptotermes formosanus]